MSQRAQTRRAQAAAPAGSSSQLLSRGLQGAERRLCSTATLRFGGKSDFPGTETSSGPEQPGIDTPVPRRELGGNLDVEVAIGEQNLGVGSWMSCYLAANPRFTCRDHKDKDCGWLSPQSSDSTG